MTEREGLISPETIWGREFRVPAIVGLGSCAGFEFSGLHLPRSWENAIPKFKEVSQEYFRKFFEADCKDVNLNPGQVNFDSVTGVLREISLQTEPISKIYLDIGFPRSEEGIYVGENINNLAGAVILQGILCRFLNCISPDTSYPYIERRSGGGYHSVDLKIPNEFLETKETVMHEINQRRFEVEASNIAGRFGMDVDRMVFNSRGILGLVELKHGNGGACCYHIDDKGQYWDHNVDSSWQAATLHGICAKYINNLLKNKDNKWY